MAHARLKLTLAAVTLIGGLVACNKPKGSCDARADKDKTCTEITKSSIIESKKRDCADDPISHAKGTWIEGACPHDDAIGGCESQYTRIWYYPGGRATKIEHVSQVCNAPGQTLLDAKGKKLEGVPREAWPGTATDRTVEDAMATADPKLDAVLATLKKIKVPSSAPSGSIKPSGGKTLGEPAATMFENDLIALGLSTYGSTETYPFRKANDVRACGIAAKEKKRLDNYTQDAMKRALAWCPTLQYVLVVKTTKFKNAELLNGSQFVPGIAEGYVFAYELPSGSAIGGYSWKAESSKTVTGAPHSGTIEKDFKEKIEKALDDGLKKAAPGSALQFDL